MEPHVPPTGSVSSATSPIRSSTYRATTSQASPSSSDLPQDGAIAVSDEAASTLAAVSSGKLHYSYLIMFL